MAQPQTGNESGATDSGWNATQLSVAELVGQVFEAAPAPQRGRLLEQLLGPLGVLSLVSIADGIFAKLRFRSGWQDLHIRLEDAQNVQASQVVALVERVEQVSIETVDGLVPLISGSPLIASAAAAVLVAVLVQRARTQNMVRPEGRSLGPAT